MTVEQRRALSSSFTYFELTDFLVSWEHFSDIYRISSTMRSNPMHSKQRDISTCTKTLIFQFFMSDIRVSWKSSYYCCTKNLHTNSLKSRRGFIRTKLKCVMKKPSDINNIKTLHVKHWFVVTSVEPHNVTQYFVAFSAALLWALSTLQTIVATGSDCVLFHLVGNYELGRLSQVQVWSWDAKEEVKVRIFF